MEIGKGDHPAKPGNGSCFSQKKLPMHMLFCNYLKNDEINFNKMFDTNPLKNL